MSLKPDTRYYDATTAQFTSEDTYRGDETDPLSLNLYSYGLNNPIKYTDPTGHYVVSESDDPYQEGVSYAAVEAKQSNVMGYDPNTYRDDVRQLQNKLIAAGQLAEGEADGYFGSKTLAALNSFKDTVLPGGNTGDNRGKAGVTTLQYLDNVIAQQQAAAIEQEPAQKRAAEQEAARQRDAAAKAAMQEQERQLKQEQQIFADALKKAQGQGQQGLSGVPSAKSTTQPAETSVPSYAYVNPTNNASSNSDANGKATPAGSSTQVADLNKESKAADGSQGMGNGKSFMKSAEDGIRSPDTVFSNVAGSMQFTFEQLEKNALNTITNTQLPSNIGGGTAKQILAEEAAEASRFLGGTAKVAQLAGKWGGPVASIAVGGVSVYSDYQTYSGKDLNKAVLISCGATAVIVGAAVLCTVFAAPALVAVGVGIAVSIGIDYAANNAKDAMCVRDTDKKR